MAAPSTDRTHRIEFLGYFDNLRDPRQLKKTRFPLDEILLLVLCAVLSGADGWVEVAAFGKKKLGFLRRFLPFKNGTPSHDQLGYIFMALDTEQFQQCFIDWVSAVKKAVKGVVAIDGKTLRRSFDKAGGKAAIHMISAWSSQQNLVLGQRKVDGKSNEITAIPELLDLLELKGAIITIDAMGCQRKISQKIIDKKADYLFGLKGNQGTLHDDVQLFFREGMVGNNTDKTVTCTNNNKKSHGRIETRKITICADIKKLQGKHKWPGLKSIIMVEYKSEEANKPASDKRSETRFYISSLQADAKTIAQVIRQHWGVENGLHWVMDMVFRDDECRVRKDNAPANFATIKHMASNLLRVSKGKESLRLKRHLAAWDEDVLFDLITD